MRERLGASAGGDRVRQTSVSQSIPNQLARGADLPTLSQRAWSICCERGGNEPTGRNPMTWSSRSSPANASRRRTCCGQWVLPACSTLGLPNATWLTFRRTYSSWAQANGVPGKVLADLMGHAKVDTSLNVYAQVIDGAKRAAAEKVSGELFTIAHKPEDGSELAP